MSTTRRIKMILRGKPTIEGAGVHLKRALGYHEVPLFDPFLLLDDFHSDNPEDYLPGFPWHPHRGIETVTYMLGGKVEHGDSLGNNGVIGGGDIQWMTAGSGIIHQEMPKDDGRTLWGFQLWVNLPASHKMMPPRYRDILSNQTPVVMLDNGVRIKIICGTVEGLQGPAKDIVVDPEYLDITIPPDTEFTYKVKSGYTVFAYIIEGQGNFDASGSQAILPEHVVLFGDGDEVKIASGKAGVRFLFISGKPIGEPVAWYGPIVMNTQEELDTAFSEYRNGIFIK